VAHNLQVLLTLSNRVKQQNNTNPDLICEIHGSRIGGNEGRPDRD